MIMPVRSRLKLDQMRAFYKKDVLSHIEKLRSINGFFETYQFICDNLEVDIEDVLLPFRKHEFVYARYIFASVLRSSANIPLVTISTLLRVTKCNHTTVIHAKKELLRWRGTGDNNYYIFKNANAYYRSIVSLKPRNDDEWDLDHYDMYTKITNGLGLMERKTSSKLHVVLYTDGSGVVHNTDSGDVVIEFNDAPDLIKEMSMFINNKKWI